MMSALQPGGAGLLHRLQLRAELTTATACSAGLWAGGVKDARPGPR